MNSERLIENWKKTKEKSNKDFLKSFSVNTKSIKECGIDLDKAEAELYNRIDCMQCANCCRTTPTVFTDEDISRICKNTDISKKQFLENIVLKDLDGTYTSRSVPCYFLTDDNSCKIYSIRPEACMSFPHIKKTTNNSMLKWQIRNTSVCPMSYYLLEKIKKSIENDI